MNVRGTIDLLNMVNACFFGLTGRYDLPIRRALREAVLPVLTPGEFYVSELEKFVPPLGDARGRIRIRAWRRGLRELDLVFGPYADAHAALMDSNDLAEFERLMEAPDALMLAWVMGFEPIPAEFDTPMLEKIRAYRIASSARA